jgi:uncharacterized RmlC-like cupin family protein
MARRVRPSEREVRKDNHPGMERAIAVSRSTVRSEGIYAAVVRTPPGGGTLVHHHGPCETVVYILSGRARFKWGETGTERELIADVGDFVHIPVGEVHTEENVSLTDPLEVIVVRNCPEPVTEIVE